MSGHCKLRARGREENDEQWVCLKNDRLEKVYVSAPVPASRCRHLPSFPRILKLLSSFVHIELIC